MMRGFGKKGAQLGENNNKKFVKLRIRADGTISIE